MRILFNTYPVAFDCPGGGEIQLLKSKQALEDNGIEVVLYNQWNPQLNNVDVVHYFSVQGGSSNFCNYVKNKGIPLVISPILWINENNYTLYPLDEINHLINISNLLLPNSVSESHNLSKYFDVSSNKIFVINNGIDLSFFKSSVSSKLFTDEFKIEKPFLLNVANIEKRKNQLSLIKAMKGLDLDLILLGNIRDKEYFQACLEEGNNFVRYLGYLPHNSKLLISAYYACEAFVLPSLLETPGLAALEAAATGAKIIITEEGCTQEYFQDLATYVSPLNISSIRNGIVYEISKQKRPEIISHIREKFTWQTTARQLIKAYSQVLKK
jgi:glycosyltransferase involved in cell wall biosynthesis